MTQLKDDHIRWILEVDAKGVQGEIQKISSSTIRLTEDNRRMRMEMKEVTAQIKEQEKEMNRLEKAGQTYSKAYKDAQLTVASAKSEVADYTKKIADNTIAINTNEKAIQNITREMKLEEMTMNQLKNRSKELQSQMSNTSQSLSPESFKKLGKELDAVNSQIGKTKNANKDLMQQLSSIPGPAGVAMSALKGIGMALKALIANPIGIIIMVIVGAFMALKEIINSNEESIHKLNQILAPLKVLFDAILNVIQGLVVKFLDFVQTVLSGISILIDKVPFLNKLFGEMNEKAKEGIQLERDKQSLQKRQRETLVSDAQDELKIAKLRNDAKKKDLYTDAERIKMLDQAMSLEKGISNEKVLQAKETYRLLKLEADRTKNLGEVNDKLAQAQADVFNAEKEYYTRTRRMESERSTAILEMRREQAAAAKEALENRIKEIDKTLDYEINKLKKTRMQGLLTEKQYNDKVEELTTSSIKKKMELKGQEAHKIIQYESQILDAQLKQQEKNDKALLESLQNEKDNKLKLLDTTKNATLEKLQEEETDQKIYALRASEIETQAANDRLSVINEFGKAVANAEFNNSQTKADAIIDSGKEVLSAEEVVLKNRANLHKLFAKTTADFERQFNIKTWEQRKEDELRILEKQHDTLDDKGNRLLSDEAFEIAKTQITKKYEDERLKVREQYGLVSMSELYDSELKALEDQHRLGLILEDDYEKAKLDIKLDYAQQYLDKASKFAKIGMDAVKASEDAKIATIEAKYDAEIAAAGDNEELVKEIEQRKAQEVLETQKSYADANFAMQAMQITISGATAAIEAYKAMAGIPVVGPALGIAAAAAVAFTTAKQLQIANAERQKIKSLTLGGSGSSSSASGRSGTIVMKPGFAEGGYNGPAGKDFSEGGYTGNGGKYEVAGWLPVHGKEYTIPDPVLMQPDVMDKVRSIERVRQRYSSKNPLPEGFADGGYNGPTGSGPSSGSNQLGIDNDVAKELLSVLTDLKDGKVKVNYGITEMEAEQRRKIETESKFSLKS